MTYNRKISFDAKNADNGEGKKVNPVLLVFTIIEIIKFELSKIIILFEVSKP